MWLVLWLAIQAISDRLRRQGGAMRYVHVQFYGPYPSYPTAISEIGTPGVPQVPETEIVRPSLSDATCKLRWLLSRNERRDERKT